MAVGIGSCLPAPQYLTDLDALEWDGGEPRRPHRTVSGTIDRFRPKDLSPELWSRIGQLVQSSVTTSAPATSFIAENELTVVAQMVAWADRIGQPLTAEVVLTPEFIDRFLIEGRPDLQPGSRANYRSILWKVGTAVRGHSVFPPRPVQMRGSAVLAPYSDEEIADLAAWSRGLPTTHMRRNSRALLSVGLGAGPQSEEIQRLCGTDIEVQAGAVYVTLAKAGHASRRVPVFAEWADDVVELAEESGARPLFCPERRRITRRDVIGFIERCSIDDKARFNVQQLRVTWMVHHHSIGTPIDILSGWAGVSTGQLSKYTDLATLPEGLEDAWSRAVATRRDVWFEPPEAEH